MKLVCLVLLASIASAGASTSLQRTASNTSAPSTFAPVNSSQVRYAGEASDISRVACAMPSHAFGKWWYNTRNDGPYACYGRGHDSWSMLNSYRSGGNENVHWKYTDNANEAECLQNWDYYAEDGKTLYTKVQGRTTSARDTRSWCALPVYRSGGAEWYQWGHCSCWDSDSIGE